MKWLCHEEWQEPFNEWIERHLGPACEAAGIALDQLADVVGDACASTLWGCVFEDFLASDLDDGSNIVDDYLRCTRGNARSAEPRICNSDGDEIVFTTLRYPLKDAFDRKALERALTSITDFIGQARTSGNGPHPRRMQTGIHPTNPRPLFRPSETVPCRWGLSNWRTTR
jgi:hypothetical protein